MFRLEDISFQIALFFPGDNRVYVEKVAELLKGDLGSNSVFYDFDYQSQIARPNADTLLQKIYRHNSKLILVFFVRNTQKRNGVALNGGLSGISLSQKSKRELCNSF